VASKLIVGYGTLLLRESIGHTIDPVKASETELIPVWVRDFRRLYNFAPAHYEPSNRLGLQARECAAANVEPAEGVSLNALAFEADGSEIEALDRRERNYDRLAVPLTHFETGEAVGTGFIYVFPADSDRVDRDPARLLPRWLDIQYARVGAYRVSEAFGRAFDETTFLADGRRAVLEPFREVLGELMRFRG
jgi:hypothetical protein